MAGDQAEYRAGRFDTAMSGRREQLDVRWKDLANEAGISEETSRIVRRDGRGAAIRTADTEARIERALRWRRGSIQTIRNGGDAIPLPCTPDSPASPTFDPPGVTIVSLVADF